jgi:diphosphomevalonate decarboxylase
MSAETWSASAPSNIAIIKYMGKAPGNVPLNASLSYTTPDCYSTVSVTADPTLTQDVWVADDPEAPSLSAAEQARFLSHVQRVRAHYDCTAPLAVRGKNNFPLGCGLASSASSFAALTRAVSAASASITGTPPASEAQCARWSRQASGSSCRSFYHPWSVWDGERVRAVDLPRMRHMVVVVSAEKKAVSSSAAHQRVLTSALFAGRADRANKRLEAVLTAFDHGDWRQVFSLVWAEFWDMHALFETATPGFGYMTPKSIAVMHIVRQYWHEHNDGPLVTMDAGPNVHLLFRQDQQQHQQRLLSRLNAYQILGG